MNDSNEQAERFEVVFVSANEDLAFTETERAELIAQHLAYLADLREREVLVTNGPIVDGPYRGLQVYRAGSVADASALVADDPAVRAGLLLVEIAEWICPAGRFSLTGARS